MSDQVFWLVYFVVVVSLGLFLGGVAIGGWAARWEMRHLPPNEQYERGFIAGRELERERHTRSRP